MAHLVFIFVALFGSTQGYAGTSGHPHLERRDDNTCVDSPVCSSLPDICASSDQSLAQTLCPETCDLCPTSAPDSCSPTLCLNSGVCVEVLGKPVCACPDGVTGRHCEGGSATTQTPQMTTMTTTSTTTTTQAPTTTTTTQSPCTTDFCLNSGVCVEVLGKPVCACASGNTGLHCEIVPPCTTNYCVNSGVCVVVVGKPVCACPSGVTGVHCEASAVATTTTTTAAATATTTTVPQTASSAVCATNPCLNGGTCTALTGGGFRCTCTTGRVPPFCLLGSPAAPATTVSSVTSAPSQTCDTSVFDGCGKAEVVFMIEYSRREAGSEDGERIIDHEGDFVKAFIDKLNLDPGHVRVGVVVYHDTVAESIHITDFAGDKSGLKARVQVLTGSKNQEGTLHPSGDPNLARALEYVKTNSFTGARPDAKKVVIPIIHRIELSDYTAAGQAATSLKADCVQIFAQAVARPFGESRDTIVKGIATSPSAPYYTYYNRFNDLENAAKNFPLSCSN